MFKRKDTDLIIPQREHARLAGNIAIYWGNDDFDLPKIPLSSVIKGIAFHQNGYDIFDEYPIKEMDENTLLKVFKNDFKVDMDDTEAELVNMFHQLRLVTRRLVNKPSEKFNNLKQEFDRAIENKLQLTKYSRKDFLWVDRIANLCDRISFNFSFGEETSEIIPVYPRLDSEEIINITQTLVREDVIELDNWPFSAKEIKNIVVAYKRKEYPNVLSPILLEFRLISKR